MSKLIQSCHKTLFHRAWSAKRIVSHLHLEKADFCMVCDIADTCLVCSSEITIKILKNLTAKKKEIIITLILLILGGEHGLVDRVFAFHAGSRGFDFHRGHMSERFF